MKRISILLVLMLLVTGVAFSSEKEWVLKDKVLAKKSVKLPFIVTKAMKDNVKKLPKITVKRVKVAIRGTSSQAKSVIEEMLDDKTIISKEVRYNILYPSVELTP